MLCVMDNKVEEKKISYSLFGVHLLSFQVNNIQIGHNTLPELFYNYNGTLLLSQDNENLIATDTTIIVSAKLNNSEEHQEIGSIKTRCEFLLNNIDVYKKNNKQFEIANIPEQLLGSFLSIAASTTRGMLLIKGYGTLLSTQVFPIMDMVPIIKSLHKTTLK